MKAFAGVSDLISVLGVNLKVHFLWDTLLKSNFDSLKIFGKNRFKVM